MITWPDDTHTVTRIDDDVVGMRKRQRLTPMLLDMLVMERLLRTLEPLRRGDIPVDIVLLFLGA
ncbi:hypothetical protein ACEWPN_25365 [Yoonia sp. R2-816]